MHSTNIDAPAGRRLLRLALASIEHGLVHGRVMELDLGSIPDPLRARRACFITLSDHGELRGCTGMLEPVKSLAEHVVDAAYATAFNDPRFPPLGAGELAGLALELAVLGPLRPIRVASEEELIAVLEPMQDGLVLRAGEHRATFLPKVWEQLPQPRDFLRHLRRKAGLPEDYWSDEMDILRYRTQTFAATVRALRAAAAGPAPSPPTG
jgi:AmmeMemoRadiSam system protein A